MCRILAILKFSPTNWTLIKCFVGFRLRLEMQWNLQSVLLPGLDCIRIDIAKWPMPWQLRENFRIKSKFKALLHVNKFNINCCSFYLTLSFNAYYLTFELKAECQKEVMKGWWRLTIIKVMGFKVTRKYNTEIMIRYCLVSFLASIYPFFLDSF